MCWKQDRLWERATGKVRGEPGGRRRKTNVGGKGTRSGQVVDLVDSEFHRLETVEDWKVILYSSQGNKDCKNNSRPARRRQYSITTWTERAKERDLV